MFPDYGLLRKRGFETKIAFSELVLSKAYPQFTFNLHQTIEPHHPKLSRYIDFQIDGVCFVLNWEGESLDRAKAIEYCKKNFDSVHIREEFIFCQLKKIKWEDPRILEMAITLDNFLMLNFT